MADLWTGIVVVVIGGAVTMGVTAGAFAGTSGFGNFTRALLSMLAILLPPASIRSR